MARSPPHGGSPRTRVQEWPVHVASGWPREQGRVVQGTFPETLGGPSAGGRGRQLAWSGPGGLCLGLTAPCPLQCHEVPRVQAEVQGEPAALRRDGRHRAVLGRPPGHAVPHQKPTVKARAPAPAPAPGPSRWGPSRAEGRSEGLARSPPAGQWTGLCGGGRHGPLAAPDAFCRLA